MASETDPTKQETFDGYNTSTTPRLESTARVILMGVYDDENILSTFRGMLYIVKYIWELTMQFNKHYFNQYIQNKYSSRIELWQQVNFPKPTGLNINMMPFILSREWKETQLPQYLKTYAPLITQCWWDAHEERGKICFLTIQESYVAKGKTQRRPGLHVETPGHVQYRGSGNMQEVKWQCAAWGEGVFFSHKERRGGLFMASNVVDSCVIWNCKVMPKDEREIIGHLGDIEHLRAHLPGKQMLRENKMYWITDRTPHESLPMKESGNRQFFRIVTHKLSLWYEEHSTVNPNGIVPDPQVTRIIEGNKFMKKVDTQPTNTKKDASRCKIQ